MNESLTELGLFDQMTERWESYLGAAILENQDLLTSMRSVSGPARLAKAREVLSVAEGRMKAKAPAPALSLLQHATMVFAEEDDLAGLALGARLAAADIGFVTGTMDSPAFTTGYEFALHRFADLDDRDAAATTLDHLAVATADRGVDGRGYPSARCLSEIAARREEANDPAAVMYRAAARALAAREAMWREPTALATSLEREAYDAVSRVRFGAGPDVISALEVLTGELEGAGPSEMLLRALIALATAAGPGAIDWTTRSARIAKVARAIDHELVALEWEARLAWAAQSADDDRCREGLEAVVLAYEELGLNTCAYHAIGDLHQVAVAAKDHKAEVGYFERAVRALGDFAPTYRWVSAYTAQAKACAAVADSAGAIDALRELHFVASAALDKDLLVKALETLEDVLGAIGEDGAAERARALADELDPEFYDEFGDEDDEA